MEIVVRTPYGNADVDLVAHPPTSRLLDLVQEVTGQAAPRVVRVDGRTLPSDTPLDGAGLLVGSLVETTPGDRATGDAARIRLVQLTDHGTAVERDLVDGHYRVGPGRRLHADELTAAPVEQPVFELEVTGEDVRVSTGQGDGPVRLDGSIVRIARPWRDELLDAGRRVFALRSPTDPEPTPRPAGPDGTISFDRHPLVNGAAADAAGWATRSPLTLGAIDTARRRSPLLWHRRPGDTAAFTVPIGFDSDLDAVMLDLRREDRPAFVGSERFRTALARAVLIEATTAHGPADLRVLITTTVDRIADWEWAKWLPHVRTEGDVAVATTADEVAAWTERLADDAPRSDRFSLVVADEVRWWRGRDAPLRALWASASTSLGTVLLSDDLTTVPGNSSTVVVQQDSGAVTVHRRADRRERAGSGGRRSTDSALRPPLLSAELSEEVARQLAPLDDAELERPVGPIAVHRPGLLDAVGDPASAGWLDAVLGRWSSATGAEQRRETLPVCLGRYGGPPDAPTPGDRLYRLDLVDAGNLLVTAGGTVEAVDLGTTLVVGAAVDAPPDRWSFLRVCPDGLSGMDHLDRLPHAAGSWNDRSPQGVERISRRLTHATRTASANRYTVIVEDVDATMHEMPRLLEVLVELAAHSPRLQLVLMTSTPLEQVPESIRAACAVHLEVGSVGVLAVGRSSIEGQPPHAFVPLDPLVRPDVGAGLVLRAAARARNPSSLERRLLRRRRDGRAEDPTTPFVRIADALTGAADRLRDPGLDAAARQSRARSLVPPQLPAEEELQTLLDRWPGDAVPLGSIDRPEEDQPAPYWWSPLESGSVLTIGSRRSAHDDLLSDLVVGVGARFSADDLHVYAIATPGPRSRAAAMLPHAGAVADPTDAAAVEGLIRMLEEEARRRRSDVHRDRQPDVLLLVDDVGRLRRPLGEAPIVDRLAQLASASARTGIHVVATAVRTADCRPLVHASDEVLVGALTDPEEAGRLALAEAALVDARGRCWSRRHDGVVQLARPPIDLEAAIRTCAPEPPTARPPRRPTR